MSHSLEGVDNRLERKGHTINQLHLSMGSNTLCQIQIHLFTNGHTNANTPFSDCQIQIQFVKCKYTLPNTETFISQHWPNTSTTIFRLSNTVCQNTNTLCQIQIYLFPNGQIQMRQFSEYQMTNIYFETLIYFEILLPLLYC